jgi:hypothetical protein
MSKSREVLIKSCGNYLCLKNSPALAKVTALSDELWLSTLSDGMLPDESAFLYLLAQTEPSA